MKNDRRIAIIWTPHFKTQCFRVACDRQMSAEKNYIVVCCSPTYNGIYSWDAKKKKDYEVWPNNGRDCYCVPIEDCHFEGDLDLITNKDFYNEVRKAQMKYLKTVKREKEPEWLLKPSTDTK